MREGVVESSCEDSVRVILGFGPNGFTQIEPSKSDQTVLGEWVRSDCPISSVNPDQRDSIGRSKIVELGFGFRFSFQFDQITTSLTGLLNIEINFQKF